MSATSAFLPVFWCVSPVLGLVGFALILVGISNRQPKMSRWGIGVLVLAAIGVLAAIIASRS